MNDQVLYFSHEDKRYRFKVIGDLVYVERHATMAARSLSNEAFSLETFPVLNYPYWNMEQMIRLIAWYEAGIGDLQLPLETQSGK
jgi:hypothetical protein